MIKLKQKKKRRKRRGGGVIDGTYQSCKGGVGLSVIEESESDGVVLDTRHFERRTPFIVYESLIGSADDLEREGEEEELKREEEEEGSGGEE